MASGSNGKVHPMFRKRLRAFVFWISILAAFLSGVFVGNYGKADTAPFKVGALATPTFVVVRILDLDAIYRVTPTTQLVTPTPFFTPTLPSLSRSSPNPATASPLPQPSATRSCINKAEFVRNLTLNENTALKPGEQTKKVWQIRNVGECTWTTAYSLVFSAGESFSAPLQTFFPQVTPPGATLDLSLAIVAPLVPGTYRGEWMLQSAEGQLFGIGPNGDQPLGLVLIVKPPPRPTPGCAACQRE